MRVEEGQGQLHLESVTLNDIITLTTPSRVQVTCEIIVTDELKSIRFLESTYYIELEESKVINIENSELLINSGDLVGIIYSIDNDSVATIDEKTGEVTGKSNGKATVTVKAITNKNIELQAQYILYVVKPVDFNDVTSLEGTYEITFFGMNTNNTGIGKGVISNNCNLYPSFAWKTNTECGTGTAGCVISEDKFVGRATIRVVNGKLQVHTKVAFNATGLVLSAAPEEQYQYTIYGERSLNDWFDITIVGTMNGRNLKTKTDVPSEDGKSKSHKYYFEKDVDFENKTPYDIVLYSNYDGKKNVLLTEIDVSPETRLILKKISSKVMPMKPNDLMEEPFNKLSDLKLDPAGNI